MQVFIISDVLTVSETREPAGEQETLPQERRQQLNDMRSAQVTLKAIEEENEAAKANRKEIRE